MPQCSEVPIALYTRGYVLSASYIFPYLSPCEPRSSRTGRRSSERPDPDELALGRDRSGERDEPGGPTGTGAVSWLCRLSLDFPVLPCP